jgi:hypothetical protein
VRHCARDADPVGGATGTAGPSPQSNLVALDAAVPVIGRRCALHLEGCRRRAVRAADRIHSA